MKSAWLPISRPSLNYKWALGWETTDFPSLAGQSSTAHLLMPSYRPRASHPKQPPSTPQRHTSVPHSLLEWCACWQALVVLTACEDAAVPFLMSIIHRLELGCTFAIPSSPQI